MNLTVPMVTEESFPQQVDPIRYDSNSSCVKLDKSRLSGSSPSRNFKLDRLNCPSQRSSSISGRSPRLWYGDGDDVDDLPSILIPDTLINHYRHSQPPIYFLKPLVSLQSLKCDECFVTTSSLVSWEYKWAASSRHPISSTCKLCPIELQYHRKNCLSHSNLF